MPSGRSRFGAKLTTTLLAGAVGLGLVTWPQTPAFAEPPFTRATVVGNLNVPWDLTWVGSRLLYTIRAGEVYAKSGSAAPVRVLDLSAQTYASGEGGLLGIVADPGAATNRTFYTCGAHKSGTTKVDVRVRRWLLNEAGTSASVGGVVVDGLPLSSGRHSGCRLRFGSDGKLYVGTGDAAVGTHPQDLASLGGKVLRVNADGTIPSDNPFFSRGGDARYVWTYGHRNVQGLALRPGTGELFSAEHGSDVDDEVNRLVRGGNYGWNPVPGYNEDVPMTDTAEFPQARRALWSTGAPTLATSGLTFLTGPAWGRWQGSMAVALLKDQGVQIVTMNPGGGLSRVEALTAAEGLGRIRTVQQGPGGALYLTTSDGDGRDSIVSLTPQLARALPTYRPGLDVSPVGVAAARTRNHIYLFVRSTNDAVYYRRSTDDGATWGGWIGTGVRSTSAPAVASSAEGRIDLITRSERNSAVHTWFVDGVRQGAADLGGVLTAAPAVTSLSTGTLDIVVRGGSHHTGYRKRYSRGWSGWQALGGVFSSALAASANRSNGTITLTGRGSNGYAYRKVVTAGSGTGSWTSTGQLLWSGRALSDQVGSTPVGVSVGTDSNAVVDRGSLVQGVVATYDSFPAVVARPNGSWIMFGRSSNGGAWAYDVRSGGYRNVSLGGVVR